MSKKFFKRFTPDPLKIRNHKHLQFLGKLLHSPHLWHFNRRSVSRAVAMGLFCAFLPMPFQTVPAALLAVFFQFNLPIAVALVWITNPFTTAPIFYFVYKLGSFMLGRPPHPLAFEASWEWLSGQIHWIWEPFLLGSFTVAIVSGVLGFLAARVFWRLHVIYDWQKRKRMRRARIMPQS